MESTLTRNEKFFISFGIFIIVAFLVSFHNINKRPSTFSQYETSEAINYQMVRAEEGFSEYSLEGREFDEEYLGLKAKKIGSGLQTVKPLSKNIEKGKAAIAKKLSVKAVKPATKINPTISISPAKVNPLAHSDGKSENHKGFSESEANLNVNTQAVFVGADGISNNTNNENTNTNTNKKTKKSYSQWRQEIFAKPMAETMTAFISAYRREEISSTEFQAMAQDLLEQNDANLKGLGLMALRSQPSMASLSQMVHVQQQLSVPLQSYIEQAYLSYIQPQNIQYLNQALQTQDKKLILKSLSLLSINIAKIKNGDVENFVDARRLRETNSLDLSVAMFKQLLPSLAIIGSAQVPEISPLAVQVAAMIESTQVAGL